MSVVLMPLCSLPKIADRDGGTGQYARLMLPFYEFGYWFASGQQFTFPGSTAPQNPSLSMSATNQKNPFVKSAGVCWGS